MKVEQEELGQLSDEIIALLRSSLGLRCEAFALDETPLTALGVDSLMRMRIVSALEDEFAVKISDEEVMFSRSFRDLVVLVNTKRRDASA